MARGLPRSLSVSKLTVSVHLLVLVFSSMVVVHGQTQGLDLVSWELDLNTGLLILSTSASSGLTPNVNCSKLTLVNSVSQLQTTSFVRLTGCNAVASVGLDVISFMLTTPDLNSLKLITNLATNPSDTFLRIEPGNGVRETGTGLELRSYDNGVQVNLFIPDVTRPGVVGFTLNLNNNSMRLTFDEPVISTRNVSTLELVPSLTANYYEIRRLSTGVFDPNHPTISNEVTFTLSIRDINNLKRSSNIATSEYNTFLSINGTFARDTNGNDNVQILWTNPLQVSTFIEDTTPIRVISFTLDMDRGRLMMYFDDAVSVGRLNVSVITLQSTRCRIPMESYTLNPNSSYGYSSSDFSAYVNFGTEDLNRLKQIRRLATSAENTYLTVTSSLVGDTRCNSLVPVTDCQALQVELFIVDTTVPTLLSWSLNMDVGQVSMSFSETVDVLTFDSTSIRVSRSPCDAGYRLSGSIRVLPVSMSANISITLQLSDDDLNNIKQDNRLGISNLTSFLKMDQTTITDMNSNQVRSIATGTCSAFPVDTYTSDQTGPTLVSFALDMNTGLLSLTFDEIVLARTLKPTTIAVVNATAPPQVKYRLEAAASVSSVNSLVLNVQLLAYDLNQIQAIGTLATSGRNTYITTHSWTVYDTNWNMMNEVTEDSALRVNTYIHDATPPVLLDFDFNLCIGQILMSFSEAVNVSSTNLTGITVQNSAATPMRSFSLTGGTISIVNSPILVIIFTRADLDALVRFTDIGTTIADTFIAINPFFVQDPSGNQVVGISNEDAQRASVVYSPCTGAPVPGLNLLEWNFDTEESEITIEVSGIGIEFSESAIDCAAFTLINSTADPMESLPLTGCDTLRQTGPSKIAFSLTQSDRRSLERNFFSLATSLQTTFLVIRSGNGIRERGSGRELGANDLSNAEPVLPLDLRAKVTGFDIDMNSGTLILSFDKQISEATVDIVAVTLQNSINRTVWFSPSRDSLYTGSERTLSVRLSHNDVQRLKKIRDLATSVENSYLTVTANLIQDIQGRDIKPIADGQALQATTFTPDTTAPVLHSWFLDLDSGELGLSFSETVDALTLNASGLGIQGSVTGIPNFLTGFVNTSSSAEVRFNVSLTDRDLDNIKNDTTFGSASVNSFLTIANGAIFDMSDNPVVAITGLHVSIFERDRTGPFLRSFSLDMDTGILALTYSEIVNASSFINNHLSIINHDYYENPGPSFQFQYFNLRSENIVSTFDSPVITITLTANELNRLTALPNIATSRNRTYLDSYSNVRDLSGNYVRYSIPLQANEFIPDTTSPELNSFSLDMCKQQLVLTFSEVVSASSLDPTQISILTGPGGTSLNPPLLQLTGGTAYNGTRHIITLQLSSADFTRLNSLQRSINNTFLALMPFTIEDTFGNRVTGIPPTNPLQVSRYIPPGTCQLDMELTHWSLDLDSGVLTIGVSGASLEFHNIICERLAIISSNSSNSEASVPLSECAFVNSFVADEVVINLNQADHDSLLANPNLANDLSDTYLTVKIGNGIRNSSNGAELRAYIDENAQQVTNLTEDTTGTHVQKFLLDMNLGQLEIYFYDPLDIDFTSVDVTRMNLGGVSHYTSPCSFYSLATSRVISINNSIPIHMTIQLSSDDLNEIKSRTDVATSLFNTYLTVEAHTFRDISLNLNEYRNSLRASEYVPDTTPPTILGFNLNLATNLISLTFDEPILVNSVNLSRVLLHSSPSGIGTTFYLTGGEPARSTNSPTSTVVEYQLSANDIRSLSQNDAFATSADNTYLSAVAGVANDTNNGPSLAVSTPLQVGNVIPVGTPLILQFSLDMDEGEIVLEFSNFVLASSLDVGAITLQSSSSRMENEWLTLSRESSTHSDEDGTRLTISIGNDDLNRLTMILTLATSVSDTFLAVAPNFAMDLYGNSVLPISENTALQAARYTADTTGPSIESWTLDMNVGQVSLTFNELIDTFSFNFVQITLQSTKVRTTTSTMFSLTGGSIGSAEPRGVVDLVLQLTMFDTQTIKILADLGTEQANTFLASATGMAADFNGNPSLPILDICTLQADTFIRDTTGPVLHSFAFDLNSGVMSFNFDEPVDVSTINITDLSLINHPFSPTAMYMLTGGYSLSANGLQFVLQVTRGDLNNIKAINNLAVDISTSYIFVNPGFIRDTSGNRLRSVSVVQATEFIQDITQPYLEEFSLDVCSEQLILTFDETVHAASLNPTGITVIQNTVSSTTRTYTLTGGVVLSLEDGPVVILQLNRDDATVLLQDNTTLVNSSSLAIQSAAITDLAANSALPIFPTVPIIVASLNTSCTSQPVFVGVTRVDGSCVAVPLNTTWHEPIIAESGALDIRITAINVTASSMPEVQTSALTPTSNPRRWYINATWTPDITEDVETNFTLCYTATDSERSVSRESCITLIGGVEAPQVVVSSLSPRGDILFNHAMWSLRFNKEFRRPAQVRFIRIFAANGTELITINTSRSDVTYPQGRLGRELTFQTSYLFTEKERYYVLLDAGVAQGQDLCGLDSPSLSDPTVWTVRIADITPPTLRFTSNPTYSNVNVTISWSFDEETTSQCTLVTPTVPFRVPCPNNTFVRTGLTDGVYNLFIVGTDLDGNTAQSITHSWTVDVTPPRVRITSAPPSITNQLQGRFNFGCVGEWRCTYICSVHLLNANSQYSACSGSHVANNLINDGQYEFSVIATDGVGNIGAPVTHRWSIDITPPIIRSLGDITLPCGQDYSPVTTGTPIVDAGVRLRFTDVTSAMCTVVRTWTVTDQAGNTATETQTITFSNPLQPQVTALQDINIPCGSVEDAVRNVATEDLDVTHPCDRPVSITFSDTAVVTMCGFTFTRTWMVNDDCDGFVTFNQNIRVLQQQFPDSPIDGQMSVRLNEPLAWPHYPGAMSYRVFVWEFGTNRTDQPVATLTTRRYSPRTNYAPGTRYLWQIEYVTGVNTSVPSPVWGFETQYFPDLTVTNVMIPEHVFSGQSFDVSWTVINQGNISTPTSTWTDAVYTGTTPNFASSSRRAIIAQNRFADPQDGYMSSTAINLDITFTGNLYVFVRTDIYNRVLDFDRGNNIRGTITPLEVRLTPPPNLVVESISTPSSPRSGERISISWRVRNIGLGVTATDQWTDRIHLSTDNQLDSSDVHLGDYGHTGVLGEGSPYENSANVTLLQKIYGNYHILVTTDVHDRVFEHVAVNDNTNSSSPMLVILSPPPDLVVPSIEAQATYTTGNVMTISYTVRNLGPGEPFERFWQDVVVLTPQFPGASRRIIGRLNYQGNLALDSTYTRTVSYTVWSNFPTGRYNLSVETDSGNNVYEFNNEGNNIAYHEVTILQALPDLFIADANTMVQTTSRGNTILLTYSVTNMGSAQTLGAPWRDGVTISTITLESTYFNGPYQHSELGINSGYTRSLSLSVPRRIYGNVNLYLYTDNNGRILETVETNNRYTIGPIFLPPVFPDLAITLQVHPATLVAVAGSMLTIRWTVTNIGNGLVERSCFMDQVYLDITPQLSSVARRLSAPRLCPTLHPNSRYNESASIELPATFSGPYFIIVRTDDRREIDENGSKANNVASMPITIRVQPSPDLIVTSVAYNYIQTESKDRILNVNWRVNNTGNSMNSEQSWTDQVFVSGEQTFTRDDATRIWQRSIANLRLDYLGTYVASASILIPSRIFGEFYVYVEVDGTNRITEINGEDNNIRRSANRLYIDEPAAARLTIVLNTTNIPSSLNGGENVTIMYDVANTGDASLVATSWIDRVYLIADRNARRNDILDDGIVLTQALNNRPQGLPNGDSYSISMVTRAPYGILSQLFHIAIIVDINTDLGDPDQLSSLYVNPNFILIEQGPLPDLVVIPTTTNMMSLFGGQPTTVTYRVENRGNNTAMGIWYEALFLSQDIVLDPFDTRLRTVNSLTDLPLAGSYNRSVEVFIPFDMPSGAYYFFYQVDVRDHIEESGENNNFNYQLTSIVETVSTDITAVSVSAFPTSLNYGDNVTFQWVLRNNGSLEARGYKCDSIYFSVDDTWDIMDYQIGLPQCGAVTLAPYAGNVENDRGYRQTEPTPFIAQFTYTGIVRTRSNIRDPIFENNIVTTTTPIRVSAPELLLDTLTTIELNSGEELVYRIENVPSEETLIATLISSGGDAAFHDLFLRYNKAPTGYAHDAFSQMGLSSDQRAVVRNTRFGTYYLRIESSGFNTERYRVRVLVRVARFEILNVAPFTAAPLGNVTLLFSGTVFGYYLEASLMSAANPGTVCTASRVYWFNSEQVYATFDITNYPAGMYTAQLTNTMTGAVTQLARSFEIAQGVPGQVAARLLLPGTLSIRGRSRGTITVLVANRGNTDILIPLMKLSTGGRSIIQLVDGTFTTGFSSEVNFLPNPNSGPAGILPPGVTAQVRFNLILASGGRTRIRDPIRLSYIENPEDQHDYVNMKDDLRPSTIEPRAWDIIWQNFMSSVGTTWGSLNRRVSEVATELSMFGRKIHTIESVVDYLLQMADGLLTGDLVVDIEDIEEEGIDTVVPLKLMREYSSRIKNRRTAGPMGMGWQLPWWEMKIRNVTDYEVQLQNSRSDMIKFSAVSNGLYRSPKGYHVTVDNGGVMYLDTEHQLQFMFHRQSGKLMEISFAGDNTSMLVDYYGQEWPSRFTHSNGKKLNITYTTSGRISYVDVLDQDDNIEQSSLYSYDETEIHLTGITTSNSSTSYTYNEQGDLTSINYATGKRKTLEYDDKSMLCGLKYYNNVGEFTAGTSFTQDGNGNVELVLLPRNQTQMMLFDMEGIPIAVRPEGGLPSYAVGSPNVEGQRTILGDKVLIENYRDEDTDTTTQIDANGNRLTYQYGEYGLERFVDSDGNEYRTMFDNEGRITEYQNPDNSRTRLNYDDVGHVTSLVNPDGSEVAYSYDLNDQVIQKSLPGDQTSFEYDEKRHLRRATNSQGSVMIFYNTNGSPHQIVYSNGRTLTYGYNDENQRSFIADNNGYNVTYTYDGGDRLSEIRQASSGELVSRFEYNSRGRLSRKTLGNGAYTMYGYEEMSGLLTELRNYLPNGTLSSSFLYEYDSERKVRGISTHLGNNTYGYDASGQLVKWTDENGDISEYRYDSRGNRLVLRRNGREEGYSVNNMNQYMEYNGTETFLYDMNGNLREKGSSERRERFVFDAEGRLTRTETPDIRCSYLYDPLGNLYGKNCLNSSIEYLVDPFGRYGADIIAEIFGNETTYFIHSFEEGLAAAMNLNNMSMTYYEQNGEGSIIGVMDDEGNTLNRYKYDPFGKILQQSEESRNIFKYAGRFGVICDEELQHVYMMRARHYDAKHGRFISPDPLGLSGSAPNFYAYVRNNPLTGKDPSGKIAILLPFIGWGALGVGAYIATQIKTVQPISLGGVVGSFVSGAILGPFGGAGAALNLARILKLIPITFFANTLGSIAEKAIDLGREFLTSPKAVLDTIGGAANTALTGATSSYFGKYIGHLKRYVPKKYAALYKALTDDMQWCLKTLSKFFAEQGISFSLDKLFELISEYGSSLVEGFVEWIGSFDPNDILGPAGYGAARFIPPELTLEYTVRFENEENATAPAQRVFIVHGLDNDLDIRTFRLGSFGFGDFVRNVTINRAVLQDIVNLTETHGVFVRVRAGIDVINNQATWELQALDPETGEPPADPRIGFLPPNNDTDGQGFVTFSVRARRDVQSLSRIDAMATIFFDQNEPIETSPIFNTIDSSAPSTGLTVNQDLIENGTLALQLNKTDIGSGVDGVDIYQLVSEGTSLPVARPLVIGTKEDTVVLPLSPGSEYTIFASTVDNVGNRRSISEDMQNVMRIDFPMVEVPCPSDCSNRGNCTQFGTCQCDEGFYGPDCSQAGTQVQPPILVLSSLGGIEDTPVGIQLSAMSAETGSPDDLLVHITSYPQGSSFNQGSLNADVWTFTPAEFGEIQMTLPGHYSGIVDIQAHATSSTDATVLREGSLQINVQGIADAPFILADVDITGLCDNLERINLPIFISLIDTDGSETLGDVIVTGLPEYASVTDGQLGPDGEYTLNPHNLSTIVIQLGGTQDLSFVVSITAQAVELGNRDIASANISVPVECIRPINECEEGTHKCEQICTDTEESYTCSCRDKYVLDENGFNCTERVVATETPGVEQNTIIIGSVVGGVALIILVVFIVVACSVVLYYGRRQKDDTYNTHVNEAALTTENPTFIDNYQDYDDKKEQVDDSKKITEQDEDNKIEKAEVSRDTEQADDSEVKQADGSDEKLADDSKDKQDRHETESEPLVPTMI